MEVVRPMHTLTASVLLTSLLLATPGCSSLDFDIAADRSERFLGKVSEETARHRGGEKAVLEMPRLWIDWRNYYATSGADSKVPLLGNTPLIGANRRGIAGALLDLELQRMEMIKFNLFDNSGTYEKYTEVWRDPAGVFHTPWVEMRISDQKPPGNDMDDQEYARAVARIKHDGLTTDQVDGSQQCKGHSIRFRDLNGYCNDIHNPLMGSTYQPFARNVQFEAATFTDLDGQKQSPETRNRHADRLSLLQPNPQLISRTLFSRDQTRSVNCNEGRGSATGLSTCDYEKANSFNVLAAFWIQFMTHDWFSHAREGRNAPSMMSMGCTEELQKAIKCRPEDQIGEALIDRTDPGTFDNGKSFKKAQRRTLNRVTAWWDASQIYGYDETSRKRVKRDGAKLLMHPIGQEPSDPKAKAIWKQGYLPALEASDRDHMNPLWEGQEATAFPDNWSIGLSFFHNVFAREHNKFVDYFRSQDPKDDSGIRTPEKPKPEDVLPYGKVTDEELFEIARLVVSAEIAKIHTTEWTTQLLYDEALHRGMNANWSGLFDRYPLVSDAVESLMGRMKRSGDLAAANLKYSAFAGGPGIFGMRNEIRDCWHIVFCPNTYEYPKPEDINGGTHHFGSPFNFPEEFITVYRLHPMVPDLIEYRKFDQPDHIAEAIPVVETFRKKATTTMHDKGLANLALSMGRQRLGRLTLLNHPQFLQNLRIDEAGHQIDVAALDIMRDRERGIPRFNEFRRQYGLRTLTSFDDFIDESLLDAAKKDPAKQKELDRQTDLVKKMRAVYGRHKCDKAKVITTAQKRRIATPEGVRWEPIDDCLGHPNATEVDNVEDLDTVVGWLAEPVRPHGFAISETQFQVFILNASRRLFSDRFFTSSFTEQFYSKVGVEWVMNNGPEDQCVVSNWLLFHKVDPSPLKCVLRRTIPELEPELAHVVNAFDPWARDRGEYYDLQWTPRKDAKADEAFH